LNLDSSSHTYKKPKGNQSKIGRMGITTLSKKQRTKEQQQHGIVERYLNKSHYKQMTKGSTMSNKEQQKE